MQILSKAVSAPDIYEYDYKGFFDSINTAKVLKELDIMGLPRGVVLKLRSIAESAPKRSGEDRLPEHNAAMKTHLAALKAKAQEYARESGGRPPH
jgi:hypothetical protein